MLVVSEIRHRPVRCNGNNDQAIMNGTKLIILCSIEALLANRPISPLEKGESAVCGSIGVDGVLRRIMVKCYERDKT